MTDTSVVTILRVEGREIDMRVRTTTAGGLNDWSASRSFALLLLSDARRRARDDGFQLAERPIDREIPAWEAADESWYVSEPWMIENVGRYVEKTEVLARRNVLDESAPDLDARIDAIERATAGLDPLAAEAKRCGLYHYLDLRVTVTDARWLEGTPANVVFGSTAHDVWFADPLNPDEPTAS
jgi:hypothetical protein